MPSMPHRVRISKRGVITDKRYFKNESSAERFVNESEASGFSIEWHYHIAGQWTLILSLNHG